MQLIFDFIRNLYSSNFIEIDALLLGKLKYTFVRLLYVPLLYF